jgi:hypothetical protein
MIVDDFDIVRVAVLPAKTNPPLIVDPDAVLTLAIPFQGFEPISWGHHHLSDVSRSMQNQQFTARHALNIRRKSPRGLRHENAFGL